MSANQQFKTYMGKLERAAGAGGPIGKNSRAKLALLEAMDRTARFQWFCANVIGEDVTKPRRERKDKRAEAAHAIAEAVGHDTGIDRNAGLALLEMLAEQLGVEVLGVQVVEDEPKVARAQTTRKPRKAAKPSKAQTEGNSWRKTYLAKLGHSTKVGSTFKYTAKNGNKSTWTIVSSNDTHVVAVKN